jgi:BMFP domain-containing protein YqiC
MTDTTPSPVPNFGAPIFYHGKPAISLSMMADFHRCPKKSVREAFRRNRQHLILGEDFVEIPAAEFNRLIGEEKTKSKHHSERCLAHARGRDTVLLFETGYLLLSKPMTDDEAWKVMRALVMSYFKARPVAAQTPAVDLAPVMAKLDSLAARLEALEAQVASSKEADSAAPRGAEIIVARLLDALSKNAAENALRLNELENRLIELEQRLRCDAIDGRHNVRQFIKTELAKQLSAAPSPLSAASAPPMSETPSSPLSRVESEAWARLIAAWWSLFGGKRRAAREIVALAEAGLFDAATQAGRSRQFAVAAERSEGISYPVQDGALIVRLRRGERKAGLPFLYWLEPEL